MLTEEIADSIVELTRIVEDSHETTESRSQAIRDLARLCERHGVPMPSLAVPT